MDTLKVGIIGLGVGERHIDAFNSHPQCQVATLCDFSTEKLSSVSKENIAADFTLEAEDILNDPQIDIVSIASFDNYHFDQIELAIKNRKHVFVEKPLCLDFEEAVFLRALLEKNTDIQLSSNLNLRTSPLFLDIKKKIAGSEWGDIFYMEGDYLWGRVQKLTSGWRKDMPFYSIIHGAAVHMIDLLIWIVQMKPVEVQGLGNNIATAGSGFGFNDFAAILLKFENGMIIKITANAGCVHPHFHKVSIFGTKKTFEHNWCGSSIYHSRDNIELPVKDELKYPAVQEKPKVITSFIDSIISPEKDPVVPMKDVFDTMSICFAAEKAVIENKQVVIEYI